MVSDVLLSAIIQAVVLAATLILTIAGLTLWFSGKFSDISSSIASMDDSIDAVEDSVRDVDLKEIEKTVLRLEYALGTEVEGDNSVYHELPQSGIGVTISLVEEAADELDDPLHHLTPREVVDRTLEEVDIDPDVDIDELTRDSLDELIEEGEIDEGTDIDQNLPTEADLPENEITYLALEFDERINSRLVTDKLTNDDELEQVEMDMFGYECGFNALSPIEMQFSVPTTDYEQIGEWLDITLGKIDEYHSEFVEEAEQFDTEIESVLKD